MHKKRRKEGEEEMVKKVEIEKRALDSKADKNIDTYTSSF